MARSPDGVEIAYATHGAAAGAEAPAVVLVHGWAGNRTYWDHQVGYLGERNLVVAVDLGGHGRSGLGRAEWSLAAFGDDVVAVVDEVGAQRVALVGHSMGGDAIVYAARQLGDRQGLDRAAEGDRRDRPVAWSSPDLRAAVRFS